MPSFSYFELHSPDLARARAFYGELFQWKFDDVPASMPYATVKTGGALNGGAMADTKAPPMWLTYVNVDDLVATLERAQRLGAKVLQPKTQIGEHGTMAVISDPTGATFALWQEPKK